MTAVHTFSRAALRRRGTPEPSQTPEPTICDLAVEALYDPAHEHVGSVIGAERDPDCYPHWIPWVPHRSPSPHPHDHDR